MMELAEPFFVAGEYSRYCDTVAKTAEWGGEPEVSSPLSP